MAGQGLDLVRIGLGAWEYDDQTYLRRSSYVSELQSLISTAADNGLTVELGNWDSMGDGARITHDYSAWHSFWLALKPVIETNRNVIVEPFNEPNGISESKWLSVWEKELNFWRHQMKYPGVIVVDTNDHSSDFSMSAIHELTDYADRLGGNILFSIHSYATEWPSAAEGFVSGMYSRSETDEQAFNSRYTAHEQSYPILIDETGNANGSPGGDYNAATSASGPSPNYWLWLTQFHSAMASDVLDDGLNGEIGFAFSWSRGDCMITYCYGAGGHAAESGVERQLGPDIRELLCEAVLATTLVRRELNLVATRRPHVVENALEQSIQWSRGPTDPVVRSRWPRRRLIRTSSPEALVRRCRYQCGEEVRNEASRRRHHMLWRHVNLGVLRLSVNLDVGLLRIRSYSVEQGFAQRPQGLLGPAVSGQPSPMSRCRLGPFGTARNVPRARKV